MLLSIVIPAYNERRTLPGVLPAVVASLPGVFKEIIIVDDGSTDGMRERLRAHSREEGGFSAKINWRDAATALWYLLRFRFSD